MSRSILPPDNVGAPQGFASRRRIGPIAVVATHRVDAAENLCRLAVQKMSRGAHVHLVNAYTVAIADRDPSFAEILSGDSVNLPDGKPLMWVSRMRRDKVALCQVRGTALLHSTFDRGRAHGVRHFLLGSTPEVLAKLETNLLIAFPGAVIVGTMSPPFRPLSPEEISDQDREIAASQAHVVWVGLGTPKQDYEAKRLSQSLPVVAVAVGAAFDFTAGTVKEAPQVFVSLGIEWVYRFAKEPRRLWRRYVFGNGRFIVSAIRHGREPLPSGDRAL
jgi:N-acetylglucosaminyldiphosphoundecaprenol N-acetyl-beta-D-mannosaminyltransferase